MTREEKQKAIDALKISAPVMAVTQEEFNDYIQTLNKIMDWLEQDPCEDWYDVPSDEMTLEQARQAVKDLRKKLAKCLEQESCDDAVSRILKRMWNCRGKHTTSIDKVAMEQILREELPSVTKKTLECDDTVSRGVFEQVRRERDIAIEQLHELGYELGQKIEPCDAKSRDMALEKMADYVASGYADSAEDFEEYSKIICQLPSVTQKSGKWILLDECANSGYYCSNCQKKLVKEGWSDTVKKIKFCPNCGADMRGEK